MARIVVTTYGTLGDTFPLIALAQRLQQQGHQLMMALDQRMHEHARRCGLACVANGRPPIDAELAGRFASHWNHLGGAAVPSTQQMIQLLGQMLDEALPQLLEACRGADLLLATPQQLFLATLVAEGLSLPLQPVSVTPSLHGVELSEEALARAAAASSQSSAPIEQLLVRARIRLGLAANDAPTQQQSCRERLLLGSSPHFCRAVGEDADAVQTGFWFHDDPRFAAWQPERELRAFMEQDPAPLVLSFSSQPLADARAIVAVHAQAAARLGRPLLIQQGWAGFRREHLPSDCDPAAIRFEGFLPQDWLFAQASALIHHGGIGTTARALRNDCPMLVEPFGNDQFFNARQIVGLGLGAAMHPEQLRPEAVAEVLQRRVLTQETHARVGALGALLRAENGLEAAVAHVETRLCS